MILFRCLRVTRSGFYAWQRRPESVHTKRDRHLKVLVRASFDASKHRYGSPRIYKDLREQDEQVGRKRVIRLMQEEGLEPGCVFGQHKHLAGDETQLRKN